MPSWTCHLAGALLLLCAAALLPSRSDPLPARDGIPPPLRVGFAEADITPDLDPGPVYLAGFGHDRKAVGVHDRLKARAVALEHGGRKIALVSVDLVGLFRESILRVRDKLPGFDYVLVSATHSHEGPDTMGLWGPNVFVSGIDTGYLRRVEDAVAAAARRAADNCAPAVARLGVTKAPQLLHDSRLPEVKHDDLVALSFESPDGGAALGLVVQWNCHPETLGGGNKQVSADFVAATVAHLSRRRKCPVVYFTGTVGGLMTSLRVPVTGEGGAPLRDGTFEKTARYGELVGEAAEQAINRSEKVELTPLGIQTARVFLPIENSLYLVAWQLGVLDRKVYRWQGDPRRAAPLAGRPDGKTKVCVETEVGLLRLGELGIAAVPGEIYPELVLGLVADPAEEGADFPDAPAEPALYKRMRTRHRMLIGLANDEIGYIIPRRQWDTQAPFCYGRRTPQYGETNSLGPQTAPLLCEVFRELASGQE